MYTAPSPPPHPTPAPNLGNSRGSRRFVSIHTGTHLNWSPQERGICYVIHLLIKSTEFGRFPDKGSLKHVPKRHTGSICQGPLRAHLSHCAGMGGEKKEVAPPGRTLRPNNTPGFPLPRCSANQNSSMSRGYD